MEEFTDRYRQIPKNVVLKFREALTFLAFFTEYLFI